MLESHNFGYATIFKECDLCYGLEISGDSRKHGWNNGTSGFRLKRIFDIAY